VTLVFLTDSANNFLKLGYQYENIYYVNAIGGLIKSSNNKNAANLLGEEIEANRQINVPISEVGLQIATSFLSGCVIIFIAFLVLTITDSSTNKKISNIDKFINSSESISKMNTYNELNNSISTLATSVLNISTISDCINPF